MNPINTLKKWLLNILVPHIEGMPKIDVTFKKNKDFPKEQKFRNLFKKRKSAFLVGVLVCCLIVFGIGRSFSLFTGLIACSPLVVIFWSSFGEQLTGLFKFKRDKK